MATSQQNFIAALSGEQPEHIPFAIYSRLMTDDVEWQTLVDAGLRLIDWTDSTCQVLPEEIERFTQDEPWHGEAAQRTTLRTPVGEITQLSAHGWVQEYWLKSPTDYRVMEYIVRNTLIKTTPEKYQQDSQELGDRGINLIAAGRSPMQTILVDYAGLENFTYHLAEGFPELFSLAEALTDQLMENCRLIAAGPGDYVDLLENLTAESWGPKRFTHYHLPVYEKILPILHAGGKTVFTHMDGQLACLAELIAQTEIDGIESLTQPPEGDMTYAQARRAWADKLFLANINVSKYDLPPAALQQAVRQMAQDASPDGRLLVFEISEDLPQRWRQSIPVILDVLADLG